MSHVENVANDAVVTTFVADFAYFPLKCPAGDTGKAAESTFSISGKLGCCHRNDTNAAKCSRNATAVSFVPAAALFAIAFRGDLWAGDDMWQTPK